MAEDPRQDAHDARPVRVAEWPVCSAGLGGIVPGGRVAFVVGHWMIFQPASVIRYTYEPRGADRDRYVALPERAGVRDRSLVVHDAPRSRLGEPRLLGGALGSRRQTDLEIDARQVLARRQDVADAVL